MEFDPKEAVMNRLFIMMAMVVLGGAAAQAQVKTYIRIEPGGRRWAVVRSLPQEPREEVRVRIDPTSAEHRSFYPTDHRWVQQANPTKSPSYTYRQVAEKKYPTPGYNWPERRRPYTENYNAFFRRQAGQRELPYPDELPERSRPTAAAR